MSTPTICEARLVNLQCIEAAERILRRRDAICEDEVSSHPIGLIDVQNTLTSPCRTPKYHYHIQRRKCCMVVSLNRQWVWPKLDAGFGHREVVNPRLSDLG